MIGLRWMLLIGAGWLISGCQPEVAMTNDSPGIYPEPAPAIVDPVGIRPIPPIPAALHGCWDFQMPSDPEEPGNPHRLVITATTIVEIGSVGPRSGTADYVEKVTATSIHGRFSIDDENGPATLATALILDSSGTLEKDEGDAGSGFYSRCKDPSAKSERG